MSTFFLEDYRAVLQSLFRHDASIVSMRTWIVAAAFTYFGLALRASPAETRPWTVVLLPPLILWCISYLLTTYERMNSRMLADIVLLLESIFTIDVAEERTLLGREYVPMRRRLETYGRHTCAKPYYYIACLTDTPVWTWHLLLLVAILGTGYVLAGTGPCSTQSVCACIIVATLVLVFLALCCKEKVLHAARKELYSVNEMTRVEQHKKDAKEHLSRPAGSTPPPASLSCPR